MQNKSIIVVDNDSISRKMLEVILSKEGFYVDSTCNGQEAIEKIKNNKYKLVIADLALPDYAGFQFLSDIKSFSSSLPVLALYKNGTIEIAVETMKRGAFDFLTKPFSDKSVIISAKKAIDKQEDNSLDNKIEGKLEGKNIITDCPDMIQLLKDAGNIANSSASVLIQGESGTGKELLAAYIVNHSGRENQPYVTMNCAALPENLAESELFGHEKGSFTGALKRRIGKFEQAHRGTLLLDEISELSLSLQAKLLRVLQEKKIDRIGSEQLISIDTRIISTCNINLKKAVDEGKFRKDLFYRINVVPLIVPPLRDRKEDIPRLTHYFIEKFNQKNSKYIENISDEALNHLCRYKWPGNIRELENVVERAVLISDSTVILPEHLLIDKEDDLEAGHCDVSVGTTVKDMEKQLIVNTLRKVNDNRTHAAQLLGISIRTLRNKLHEYRNENIGNN